MSNEEVLLTVTERTVVGKSVKGLRRDGIIPAVIHDHGSPVRVVMAPAAEITKAYSQVGRQLPVNITFGKQKLVAVIKEVDFDPKKHLIRHVVFNAIKQNEKVETDVVVHLEGDSAAEKASLVVSTVLDRVKIAALPKDLVDNVVIDISALTEVGDKVTVADIKTPSGVTILTEADQTIAVVEEKTVQPAEEPEAESTEEAPASDGESKPDAKDSTEAASA